MAQLSISVFLIFIQMIAGQNMDNIYLCSMMKHRRPIYSSSETDPLSNWNCDFNTNSCGIYNQHNMNSYFTLRTNASEPIFGKDGMLFLDVANAHSAGARLITQYFPTNGCRYGCLTIEHIMCGTAPKRLYLIQQDQDNMCIWKKNNYNEGWTNSSITVDLSRGMPRFFIEAHFNRRAPNYGFIAIGNINFQYNACGQNEACSCHLNPNFYIN